MAGRTVSVHCLGEQQTCTWHPCSALLTSRMPQSSLAWAALESQLQGLGGWGQAQVQGKSSPSEPSSIILPSPTASCGLSCIGQGVCAQKQPLEGWGIKRLPGILSKFRGANQGLAIPSTPPHTYIHT